MEEADPGALAEGAALRKGREERVADAAGKIVEARVGVGAAATDAQVKAVEAVEADGSGDRGEEQEGDSL